MEEAGLRRGSVQWAGGNYVSSAQAGPLPAWSVLTFDAAARITGVFVHTGGPSRLRLLLRAIIMIIIISPPRWNRVILVPP